jgi:hypothetical protein
MQVVALGRVLWDYLRIGAPLERREAIVAFGGHDLRVSQILNTTNCGGGAVEIAMTLFD